MWTCPICGETVPGEFDVCWKCQSSRESGEGGIPEAPNDALKSPVMSRYADGYTVANAIVAFGALVKGIGMVAAVLVFIGMMSAFGQGYHDSSPGIVVGLVSAAITGGVFYLMGILVSAQGQILRATLDSAVHSSPFLTQEERRKVMSLK